ncbi:MAG: hypothetical protein GXO26_00825 [Crenarchaeota archaeon]|nr:hypothetical protein [Thermoproteota archaeon]
MSRQVRNYLLNISGTFCCGRQYGGVQTATYKTTLNYVPASQIFGLLLATYLHLTSEIRELSSSLDLILQLSEISENLTRIGTLVNKDDLSLLNHICRIWPAYPKHENITQLLDEIIKLLRTSRETCVELVSYVERLRDLVSENPYLASIVPGPRVPVSVCSLYDGESSIVEKFSVKLHKINAPLCLMICPSILFTILSIVEKYHGKDVLDKILSKLGHVSHVKRAKLGICVDRYRHTSKYGLFYVYETVTYSNVQLCSLIENFDIKGLDVSSIVTGARFLKIGFKKGIDGQVRSVATVFRSDESLINMLINLANNALDICLALSRSCRFFIGLACIDKTLITVLDRDMFSNVDGSYVCSIFSDERSIYLQIMNKFYNVKYSDRDLFLITAGSCSGVTTYNVDKIRGYYEKIFGNYVNVIRMMFDPDSRFQVCYVDGDRIVNANPVVRRLVLAKVGVCHTGVIPIIWVTSSN